MEPLMLKDWKDYSDKDKARLMARWSQAHCDAVAKWFATGAKETDKPDCVEIIGHMSWDEETLPVYDLRAISLLGPFETPLGKKSTKIDLRLAHLEGAHLSGQYIEDVDLSFAYLQGANLVSAHLGHANLRGAHLANAILHCADLRGANLHRAHLMSVRFHRAHMEGADLRGAHLEKANLSEADIRGADFSHVSLEETVFKDVVWDEKDANSPVRSKFEGFDVRGIRYSDPRFDQKIRQSEFIRSLKDACDKGGWLWRRVFSAWRLSCDCGRSIWRWLITCAVIILGFSFLFAATCAGGLELLKYNEIDKGFLTHLYFSVVTFSTLGFGDVTPIHWGGKVAVIAEVFLGYVMLGGLISIFTTKLVPPR